MSMQGNCKFFNSQKGFGFITGQDGTEYFVHYTAINAEGHKSLAEGEPVQFDLQVNPSNGKQCAANVSGPGGAPVQGAPRPQHNQYGGKGGYGQQQGGFQQGGFGGQQGGFGGFQQQQGW
jgi:protein lin-28